VIPEERYPNYPYFGGGGSVLPESYYCDCCKASFDYEHETFEEYEIGRNEPVLKYCAVSGRTLDLVDFQRPSESDMDYVYKSLGVERGKDRG